MHNHRGCREAHCQSAEPRWQRGQALFPSLARKMAELCPLRYTDAEQEPHVEKAVFGGNLVMATAAPTAALAKL